MVWKLLGIFIIFRMLIKFALILIRKLKKAFKIQT